MMTKYDDDERVGKRIRGRRNWPDSGAAGEAEEIRRRPRWGRRIHMRLLHNSKAALWYLVPPSINPLWYQRKIFGVVRKFHPSAMGGGAGNVVLAT